MKKRPTNSETGRKRAGSQSGTVGVAATAVGQAAVTGTAVLHNGTDAATFLKPEALPTFSQQEYYEADEILKVSPFQESPCSYSLNSFSIMFSY